jgi:hypothetical protein
MATARRIINRALRLIQVLAAGETPRAAEAEDALEALNDMLASWSTSRLSVPAMVKRQMTLAAGPARVFLATRPMRVVGAWINDGSRDLPLAILGQAEYLGIGDKTFSARPTALFYEDTTPIASISLYPVPDKAYALTLQAWEPLAQIGVLDDEIDLPGEYREVLSSNLAVRLAPEYGTSVSAEVSAMATSSLDALRSLHAQPVATLSVGIQSTTRRYADGVGNDAMSLFRSGLL